MAFSIIILAWEIPWTEESGGLQSMGSQKNKHDLATKKQSKKKSLMSLKTGEYSSNIHLPCFTLVLFININKISTTDHVRNTLVVVLGKLVNHL